MEKKEEKVILFVLINICTRFLQFQFKENVNIVVISSSFNLMPTLHKGYQYNLFVKTYLVHFQCLNSDDMLWWYEVWCLQFATYSTTPFIMQ